jgi:hypothetical protein
MSYSEINLSEYTNTPGSFPLPDDPSILSKLQLGLRDKSKIDKIVLHHSAGWGAGEEMINGWSTREYKGQVGIISTQWQGLYIPNEGRTEYNIGGKKYTSGNYFIKNYDPDKYYGGHSTRGNDYNTVGIEVVNPGWDENGSITAEMMKDDGFNQNAVDIIGGIKMYKYPADFSYALGQWCNAECSRYGIPKVVLCDYVNGEWITTNNIEEFKEKISFRNLKSANFNNYKGITCHFHTDDGGNLDITPSFFFGDSGEKFFQGLNNGGFGGSTSGEMNMFEVDIKSGKTYVFYFESNYFLNKDSLTQKLMAPIYSNPITSNEKLNNDRIKDVVKQIVYSKFESIYNLDPNEISLVPLEFNMVIDGISGISIGDVIDCEFLPDIYRSNTVITVTGINSEISGNDWKTNLKITVKAVVKTKEKDNEQ